MGLPEILMIVNLIATAGLVVLVLVMSKRLATPTTQNQVDTTALLDSIRRMQQETERNLRTDLQKEGRDNRGELSSSIQANMTQFSQSLRASQRDAFDAQQRELQVLFENQSRQIHALIDAQEQKLTQLLQAQQKLFEMQDKRLADMQTLLIDLISDKMEGISTTVSNRLADLEKQFNAMREQSRLDSEQLRRLVEEKLTTLQSSNTQQLEQMRATVDEKLQTTLNTRISESFKLVNERLAEVYQGLGEMKTLATHVGDLKKVMSGVKTRGILGEIQLGAIIEEMLSPEQYEANIATVPNSSNRVEYAIKLPGDGSGTVYLPIDAKFPADAYEHLLGAYDSADPEQVKAASATLEQRIKSFAKDIRDKYISTPYTTNFGIMFLPTEGLYAEVVRLGLVEVLQRQYSISVAGPTTLAALLSSLQMGFRTLAIQKRSGEVWEVLGAVKTEFGNFQAVLEKAQARIDQTSQELDKLVGVRTRKINSKLRSVSELPVDTAQALIDGAVEEE